MLEKSLVPKTTKREKYALNIVQRLENFVKNVESDNKEASLLYDQISKLEQMVHSKDVDKFLMKKLNDYDWGKSLLKQQDMIDQRTLSARQEVGDKNMRIR